jgi:predicted RNA binding protein YcfA (HicA-like mRNA interferase family)
MKLARDISATELIKSVSVYQYVINRQKGSHSRLATLLNGEHHITIPNHDPIKIGTLSSILNEIATHLGKSREEVISELFGK